MTPQACSGLRIVERIMIQISPPELSRHTYQVYFVIRSCLATKTFWPLEVSEGLATVKQLIADVSAVVLEPWMTGAVAEFLDRPRNSVKADLSWTTVTQRL